MKKHFFLIALIVLLPSSILAQTIYTKFGGGYYFGVTEGFPEFGSGFSNTITNSGTGIRLNGSVGYHLSELISLEIDGFYFSGRSSGLSQYKTIGYGFSPFIVLNKKLESIQLYSRLGLSLNNMDFSPSGFRSGFKFGFGFTGGLGLTYPIQNLFGIFIEANGNLIDGGTIPYSNFGTSIGIKKDL
ncbi:MAG: hypothetical protein SFU91_14025 [Chloroherpetonaceae bacterium]|nr:hypothetical protein [Chloroherpetonaceae bacterium]